MSTFVLFTGLDGASQVEAFNQLWTLKESFVKATGLGINGPPGLKDFSFQIQAAACDGISSSKLPEDHSVGSSFRRRRPLAELGNTQPLQEVQANADEQPVMQQRLGHHQIDFQPPTGSESGSWFALLAPMVDHVAAVCIQPIPNLAGCSQFQDGAAKEDQEQRPLEASRAVGPVQLSSFQVQAEDCSFCEQSNGLIGSSMPPGVK